jgi:hypothetical protein
VAELITKKDLDDWCAAGCGNPECPGCHGNEQVTLCCRFHRDAPFFLVGCGPGGTPELRCVHPGCPCRFRFAGRLLPGTGIVSSTRAQFLEPPCHRDDAYTAEYSRPAGRVELSCYRCGNPVAAFDMNELRPTPVPEPNSLRPGLN